MEREHLRANLQHHDLSKLEDACVSDASDICDFTLICRDRFNLHHLHLLCSFSVYLALVVLLERHRQSGHMTSRIRILWSTLLQLKSGPNPGLGAPLQVIEHGISIHYGPNFHHPDSHLGPLHLSRVSSSTTSDLNTNTPASGVLSSDTTTLQDIQLQNSSLPAGTVSGSQTTTEDYVVPWLVTDANPLVITERQSEEFITSFVDTYPSDAAEGSPTWVRAAAEISKTQPLLRDALKAVAMITLGKVRGDLSLEQSGGNLYRDVLIPVSKAINNPDGCTSISILLTVVLLSTAEVGV